MKLRRTISLSLALLVVSAVALAKQAHSAQDRASSSAKEKHAKADPPAGRSAAKQVPASGKTSVKPASRRDANLRASTGRSAAPDQYVGALQIVGTQQTGSAAWYGPRHLGHRTASGDRLDGIRATAAHRSLPLNSLARVTNLKNGRSVVVKVTDRGPWSPNLLIDVSPKAADELDMKRAGIVPVRVEAVVPARPRPQLASGVSSGAN